MSEQSTHLSEEDLVDHYYGEGSLRVARHLKACSRCAREFSALEHDLGGFTLPAAPPRGEDYGEQIWRSIRGSVTRYEPEVSRWPALGFRRPLTLATAFALLMIAAFLAGRLWQRRLAQPVTLANKAEVRERVVVWVLGDHLDRSERLLVELNHADGKDAADAQPIQSEARELLAANRLIRQSARQSADPELDAALDRLERLLVEVANEPNGLDQSDLDRLRQEMNTERLLFDVRVLRSRVQGPRSAGKETDASARLKGVSI